MTRNALLVDAMLGRLVSYLRMCGYDTVYTLDEGIESDDETLQRAREDDRTILTRDHELAARGSDAIIVASRDVRAQLQELAEAGFELELSETPQRCGACNGPVVMVAPDDTTPEYAPDPVSVDVWRCKRCGQHFWKGSHWDDVAETLEEI